MSDIMHAKTFDKETTDEAARIWREGTIAYFKERGMTFFRMSYAPGKPNKWYIEGWYERPREQGPHPWEPGQPQPAVIVNPAKPA